MAGRFGIQRLLSILEKTDARLVNGDALGLLASEIEVSRLAPLGSSGSGDCSFFFSLDYREELLTAAPGVLITGEAFVAPLVAQSQHIPFWKKSAVIATSDPYFSMGLLSEEFAEIQSSVAHLPGAEDGKGSKIHASAVIHPTAVLAEDVMVGPHCVIEAGARIGRGTVLYPRVFVGPGVLIGEDTVIFPGVTLYEWTRIGSRVRIHAGSTIGADGFGYAPIIESGSPTGHQKIYHLGHVRVGDDVEIGANTMIDRATFGETLIESKVKIDNHVHVGHNSTIREGAILCGGVCLAGGTIVGKYVYIGGMAGIGNKAQLGDYSKIGAMSLVDKDVPAQGTSVGNPQRTHRDHFKAHAILNRMVAERDRKSRKKNEEKE